ncbi:hypothetical protein BDR22DRAFT_917004 [Usnea florida]
MFPSYAHFSSWMYSTLHLVPPFHIRHFFINMPRICTGETCTYQTKNPPRSQEAHHSKLNTQTHHTKTHNTPPLPFSNPPSHQPSPPSSPTTMHSKHLRRTAHHTMSPTYTRHRTTHSPPLPPTTTTTNPWAASQAALIHSLRDISHPPSKKPPFDILAFDSSRQVHARWTDPGLVEALSNLHDSLPPQTSLLLKYGGRDVTAATWVTVHEILPPSSCTSPSIATPTPTAVLRYVLWFHEYDDLDVEVGELRGREWDVKEVKKEVLRVGDVKVEEEEDDRGGVVTVSVKMEEGNEGVGVVKIEEEGED